MKYVFAIVLLTIILSSSPTSAKNCDYIFDKEHTTILFFVNHLGFSDKIGQFTDYSGHFTFDEKTPNNSLIDVILKPAGIKTGSSSLDKALQNKIWFNTEKYPEINFKSSKIKITGDNTADVNGWLTFLGKTKRTVLHVTFNKAGTHPITRNYVAGFSTDTIISRSLFGMINDIPFVSDKVRIHIETEGICQKTI